MRLNRTKVIFHLPKCGGSTLAANLEQTFGTRFYQFINARDAYGLERHAEADFRDIDVLMIHDPKFSHDLLPQKDNADFLTIVREPLSAAVSMYNFATNAQHTANYKKVKGTNFWDFIERSYDIPIWAPNFQSFYLCGARDWTAAENFMTDLSMQAFTVEELETVCRILSDKNLDPRLERNRAPFYHSLRVLPGDPVITSKPGITLMRLQDLSDQDRTRLRGIFDIDMLLWQKALTQREARSISQTGLGGAPP